MAADALATLVLDRFVSASSAADAHTSLESILEALQSNKKTTSSNDGVATTQLPPELIWDDDEILGALRHVLHTGHHKQHDMQVPVEDGASLVCRIYMEMLDQQTKCPLLEKDEALLECLIDVISSDDNDNENTNNADDSDTGSGVSMYTRVLALQLLTKLCMKRPSKAQEQLLKAPNGLHRLGDLLNVHQEEILRNEALLLAQVIAEWPSCAKIWIFAEVADQVMLLALEEGGLTGGNLLVQDCLDLLFKLWKHDPNLADLVFQSRTITGNLPRLLDLRLGTEFLNPPSKKAPAAKKDDDLDDILKSAATKEPDTKTDEVVIPKLTPAEEKVIEKTLNILALLLESEDLKESVWNQQTGLCFFMWELALMSPPKPQVAFVCAVPSPQLQQKALEKTSLYFHDPTTMERHKGLDRLLYLVCTGGLGSTLEEKMGISQAALHAIRRTMSAESVSQMLMYTLAPPMTMDDENEHGEPQQQPGTVVHKLLNTVGENLTATPGVGPEGRKIFLAGALGGLSIFLTDQTSREVMLRITTTTTKSGAPVTEEDLDDDENDSNITTTSLIESILHAVGKMEEEQNPEDAFLSMTLLRFLCHWAVETPSVVQAVLSSNQSGIVLSALLGIKTKTHSNKKGVAVLGKLLLGLAMEFMGEDEGKCGGWTRASIMELIAKKSGGVSKFTSTLEQFKSVRDFGDTMPWSICDLEFKVWSQWFSKCVLLVRKRVVQELTGSGEGDYDDDDDEGPQLEGGAPKATGGGIARSMQKLVYQQSQEIDELQETLKKANAKLESQQTELLAYKRRVESAPSQLDTMLNEYSAKVSELETKVSTLEDANRVQEEKHKAELGSRDDQVATLQKELEESRAREKESRDETETIREEMHSLSQAYTGLEQEYREQQQRQGSGDVPTSNTATTSSEQRPGEQGQEGSQHHQSSSAGIGSTEISTVRAENERLRNDAQAAEQWMTMAVEKMQVFAQQNAALQAELAKLRESQSQDCGVQQRELQQQYQGLFEEKQALVQQQSQIQAGLNNATQEKQHLQQAYSELEGLLSNTREELNSTISSLEESRSQAAADRSEVESRLGAMARDLENSNVEICRLQEEVKQQRQQNNGENEQRAQAIAQTTAEHESGTVLQGEHVDHLRSVLEQQTADVAAERQLHVNDMEALKNSVGSIEHDLEMARAEIENVRRHEQEEIYNRESRIRELEDRINRALGGQGESLVEEIKVKDAEIAELTSDNESAQDWMQKAVNQFNMLTEQQAKLGSENASLISQVRDLKAKTVESEAAVARARVLEQESSLQTVRLREVEASLVACEVELGQVRAELSLSKNQASDGVAVQAQLLREETEALKASLQEQVSVCEQLRTQLSSEAESKVAAVEELALLKKSQVGHENAEQLRSDLSTEKEANSTAQQEIDALKSQTEKLNNELQTIRSNEAPSKESQKVSELFVQLQNAKEENSDLLRSQKDDRTAIAVLTGEVSVLRTATDHTAPAQQPAMARSAQDMFSAAPPNAPDAGGASAAQDYFGRSAVSSGGGAQDFFSAGQSKSDAIGALEDDEEVLKSQLEDKRLQIQRLEAQLKKSTEELAIARQKVASNEGVDQERIVELEAAVRDLRQERGEREQEIEKQQALCSSLETRNAELVRSIETANSGQNEQQTTVGEEKSESELRSELQQTKASLADALAKLEDDEHVVVKWEERVAELESAMKDLEIQLAEQEEMTEKWQDSYATLEEKNSELMHSLEAPAGAGEEGPIDHQEHNEGTIVALQTELEQTKAALAEVQDKLLDDDDVVVKWEEQVAELETLVKDLKIQLSDQEEEADGVIAKWHESCNTLEETNSELLQSLESAEREGGISCEACIALQAKLEEAESSLANATDTLGEDGDVLLQWQERVAQLESALKDSEEQEEEAQNAIAQWQESCTALGEKNAELARSLEVPTMNGDGVSHEAFSKMQERLQTTERELVAAKHKVNNDDVVRTQLHERVVELESTVKDLELQMQHEEEKANNVIAQWEESCTALEEKNVELVASLESEESNSEAVSSLQVQLSETQSALNDVRAKLSDGDIAYGKSQDRVSELEAGLEELQNLLSTREEEARTAIAEMGESYSTLQQKNVELTQSLEALQTELDDLANLLSTREEEARTVTVKMEESNNTSEQKNAELTQSLKALQTELVETQQALSEAEGRMAQTDVVSECEKRVADLEAVITDLEQHLDGQESEAISVVAQWEETFAALKATKDELQTTNAALEKHSKEQEEETGKALDILETKKMELLLLQDDSRVQKAELESFRESNASFETLLGDRDSALNEAAEQSANAEKTVQEWQKRAADLEATVGEIEEQLSEQEQEASGAIANWEERFMELQKEKTELAQSLEASFNRSKELTDENDTLASSQAQLTETEAALSEEAKKALDWKEQVTEMESMVQSLQQRLLDNEKDSSATQEQSQETIASCESKNTELATALQEAQVKITALEKSCAEAMEKIAMLAKEEEAASEKLEALQSSLDDARDLLRAERENQSGTDGSPAEAQGKVTELETKLQDLEDQLNEKHKEMATAYSQWQEHTGMLEHKSTELSNQLDESKSISLARQSYEPDFEGSPQDHIVELEATIKALEEDLESSETDAADAVYQWQEYYEALGATNRELAAEVKSLAEEIRSLREAKQGLESTTQFEFFGKDEKEEHLESKVEELNSKIATLEASLSALEAELQARPDTATLEQLEARCVAKDEELLTVSAQLEKATKERDDANTMLQDEKESGMTSAGLKEELDKSTSKIDDLLQQKEKDDNEVREISANLHKKLEAELEELREEHNAVVSAKTLLESQVKDSEEARMASEEVVKQWTERTNQLETAARDLEEQLEQQVADGDEAISIWETSCSELQESLKERQLELEACRAELLDFVKTELEIHERLLTSFDHDFKTDFSVQEITDADGDVLKSKLSERKSMLEMLLAKQDSDIDALFAEMENLRSTSYEDNATATEVSSNDDILKNQIVELQKQISDNEASISQLEQALATKEYTIQILESGHGELESKMKASISQLEQSVAKKEESIESLESGYAALESKVKEEGMAKEALQTEIRKLKDKLSLGLLAEEEAQLQAGDVTTEKDKLEESLIADRVKLEKLNESLSEALLAEKEGKLQLEKATAESNELRESLKAGTDAEKQEQEELERECSALKSENNDLRVEVDRLTELGSELEDELREANSAMEVYIAKEVSDRATEMAAQALRHQLIEIRTQSDTDHSAYLAEKEARVAAEGEVERLQTDLLALVDVSEQEKEVYGADALAIKAADQIYRKEKSEIDELRTSLSRAMAELRTSRVGEKDAEERAAKAAHHVVVCEQELTDSKSDMRYLLQTMEETRQDEESRRASLEHRIRSLENDLEVLRRFHSSETDSLRNELTQVVMEKDRTLQLLKDSEKNKTAMVFAASKDYSYSSSDSPEAELARLRIEKAQLLVAAAEEGARTERRLREVIATGVSSVEADILVEKERRLAAEAACDNMKLLVAELQKDVQSYREDSRIGQPASKAQMEQENRHLKVEIERIREEDASLRTKLDDAEKHKEIANYKIEKLMSECRMAQAASNRLDREIKFQTEVHAEMGRMRPSPQPKSPVEEDPVQNKAEDILPSVIDQMQHQTEAIQNEREMYRAQQVENRALEVEHEELLALLAQQQEVKSIVERVFAERAGRDAVDEALQEAKASVVARYGSCVEMVLQ